MGLVSCGKEKFWTSLNFPGFPGLGIMDKGDDWKGPMVRSSSRGENRPIYLPL